jgi:hypothetical protein
LDCYTSSFATDSTASFILTPIFVTNEEYFFYDQPVIGIKNAISDKIRLENNTLPSGDTLSAIRALSQQPSVSSSYTANTNLLEVAFSPQDEINDDIMDLKLGISILETILEIHVYALHQLLHILI